MKSLSPESKLAEPSLLSSFCFDNILLYSSGTITQRKRESLNVTWIQKSPISQYQKFGNPCHLILISLVARLKYFSHLFNDACS